ncbi:tetratricopeptide repeat protein [Paracrocinitomix mangrovi]|uniref:tetratricopeptide repeat protein n=1 Tax=Paracrocinitomix mangrovi TaxID=2862509 RepID=UPI001C8E7C58|nr:tetratricopeptide repeat protein [Paracrocinitomix mangrovi]UKN01513.1 tetratricopeptide repeat protein [Paracrocinitomix mangrovi]
MLAPLRKILLLTLLIPVFSVAQNKYSGESKRIFNKGVKEYEDGNKVEALKLFLACVQLEPTYAEAYLNISLIQFDNKQYENALDNAVSAHNNDKFLTAAYGHLGKCYYHNSEYDSAAYFLNKAIEQGQDNERIRLYAARANLNYGDLDLAQEHVDNAISKNDKNPVAHNIQGKIHYQQGDLESAEASFKKALELNPNSAGIYGNLANVYLEMDSTDLALDMVQKGMDKTEDPKEKAQFLVMLGNYYHKSQEYEKASSSFDQAFELDNENARILSNQAAVLLDQDQYESAIEKCNLALDLNPELMEAYFNRGIAHEMMRNVEDACFDWEQAFILGSEKAEEYLNSPTCSE